MFNSKSGINNNQVISKHMEEQIRNYSEALNAVSGKASDLKKCLNVIAEKVCDGEYGENQLGGKNKMLALSAFELRDFIIDNYNKQRAQYATSMTNLQNMYKQEKSEKDKISAQMLSYKEENQQLRAKINNLEYELQMAKNSASISTSNYLNQDYEDDNSDFDNSFGVGSDESDPYDTAINEPVEVKQMSYVQVKGSNQNDKKLQSDNNQNVKYQGKQTSQQKQQGQSNKKQNGNQIVYNNDGEPFNVNQVLPRVDMLQREIIKVMGEHGCNETNDIQNIVLKEGTISNSNKFREVLKACKENKLISEEPCPVALRNQLVLNSLTELGKAVYKNLYKKSPVKDEKTIICAMHDNIIHGYNIKDTAAVLKRLGYTNICMDSKKNAFPLPGGGYYIPDVTAEVVDANNKKRTKTYWEFELDNHHTEDFAQKMEKASKITNEVTIIVDNMNSKRGIEAKINDFAKRVKMSGKDISLIINLGTIKDLRDKKLFSNKTNRYPIGSKNKK